MSLHVPLLVGHKYNPKKQKHVFILIMQFITLVKEDLVFAEVVVRF